MDIMVQGEGKRFYKPDEVVLNINFYVNDTTYDTVLEKGTKSVEEFINKVLDSLNIEKERLRTRSYRISQSTRFDYTLKKQIDCGFNYNQNATLKIEYDINKISKFMDTVAKSENPPKYNMTFTIKDQEGVKKEVLSEAYSKAKEKAEIIALSAGKKLKDCIKVDFRPFEERVYSNSRLTDSDLFNADALGSPLMKRGKTSTDIIENTFTPEDVEIRETLYCLWITE